MLFCDLDGFKQVNDTRGHEAGDAVLVEVAQRLGAAVRDGDLVVRFAGDEFVIVARPEGAGHIADRLLRRLVDPITLRDGSSVHVGTSIGIADALDPTVDPVTADELLRSEPTRPRTRRSATARAGGAGVALEPTTRTSCRLPAAGADTDGSSWSRPASIRCTGRFSRRVLCRLS